jgi:hypothetical protein
MPTIDADNGDFSLPTIPEYVQGGLPNGLTNSSHVFGEILHLQPRHDQFRSNHCFLGGPYQDWFRFAAGAEICSKRWMNLSFGHAPEAIRQLSRYARHRARPHGRLHGRRIFAGWCQYSSRCP